MRLLTTLAFASAALSITPAQAAGDNQAITNLIGIQVADGSAVAEHCATPNWPSACVTFPASQSEAFVAQYFSLLTEAGWRPSSNQALLERHSDQEQCTQLLAVSILDQESWRERGVAELAFVLVGCSGDAKGPKS